MGNLMEAAPGSRDFDALLAALPKLLSTGRYRRASGLRPKHANRVTLPSGFTVLCSVTELTGGVMTHLSFSVKGAPIDLDWARQAAFLVLDATGIEPLDAAVAYSANGIFHIGTLGSRWLLPERGNPSTNISCVLDLPGKAEVWVEQLKGVGRVGNTEEDIFHVLTKRSARTPI
jgi:hypothetical protein